jgi:hypothetical protein
MSNLIPACLLLYSIFFILSAKAQENQLNLHVDAGLVLSHIKGRIGASWHILVYDIPLENEKHDYPVGMFNPRRSAFDFKNDPNINSSLEQYTFGLAFLVNPVTKTMYSFKKNKTGQKCTRSIFSNRPHGMISGQVKKLMGVRHRCNCTN